MKGPKVLFCSENLVYLIIWVTITNMFKVTILNFLSCYLQILK